MAYCTRCYILHFFLQRKIRLLFWVELTCSLVIISWIKNGQQKESLGFCFASFGVCKISLCNMKLIELLTFSHALACFLIVMLQLRTRSSSDSPAASSFRRQFAVTLCASRTCQGRPFVVFVDLAISCYLRMVCASTCLIHCLHRQIFGMVGLDEPTHLHISPTIFLLPHTPSQFVHCQFVCILHTQT